MPAIVELFRWLESMWIPAATLASLLLLLILWEVVVLLGVHIGVTTEERSDSD